MSVRLVHGFTSRVEVFHRLSLAVLGLVVCTVIAIPAWARDQSSLGGLTISASRVPDWWNLDELRNATAGWQVVDVTTLGVNVSDSGDDSAALRQAVQNAAPRTVLYIPRGTVHITGIIYIQRSDIAIRGAGMNQTTLSCDGNGHCIQVLGPSPAYQGSRAWVGGFQKGTRTLTLANTSGLSVGDFVRMKANIPIDTTNMPGSSYGYISKIVSINAAANQITLDRPVRQDMTAGNQTVERFTPLLHVGLENFSIVFGNAGLSDEYKPPVILKGVAESWVRGVNWAGQGWSNTHMGIGVAARNLIEGNTFGQLSRVALYNKATIYVNAESYDNVMENNIFVNCPVGIETQGGSAGNVTAYNYHREPTVSGGCERDYFIHGGGSYDNLFEAGDGYCQQTWDNYWGSNFKGNTFFRMRMRQDAKAPTEYNGVLGAFDAGAPVNSAYQPNVLGNSLFLMAGAPQINHGMDKVTDDAYIEANLYRNALILLNDTSAGVAPTLVGNEGTITRGPGYMHARSAPTKAMYNYQGTVTPSAWRAARNLPASLYRTSPPPFWCQESGAWPNIGADKDDFSGTLGMLPAERRYRGLPCTSAQGTWVAPPVLR